MRQGTCLAWHSVVWWDPIPWRNLIASDWVFTGNLSTISISRFLNCPQAISLQYQDENIPRSQPEVLSDGKFQGNKTLAKTWKRDLWWIWVNYFLFGTDYGLASWKIEGRKGSWEVRAIFGGGRMIHFTKNIFIPNSFISCFIVLAISKKLQMTSMNVPKKRFFVWLLRRKDESIMCLYYMQSRGVQI